MISSSVQEQALKTRTVSQLMNIETTSREVIGNCCKWNQDSSKSSGYHSKLHLILVILIFCKMYMYILGPRSIHFCVNICLHFVSLFLLLYVFVSHFHFQFVLPSSFLDLQLPSLLISFIFSLPITYSLLLSSPHLFLSTLSCPYPYPSPLILIRIRLGPIFFFYSHFSSLSRIHHFLSILFELLGTHCISF